MEKMQASLLDLNEAIRHMDLAVFKPVLSFRTFIDFLKKSAVEADAVKAVICRAALAEFAKYPELAGEIPVADAGKYHHLLEHVHALITPPLFPGKQELWALSLPMTPYFFYGTSPLYNFLCAEGAVKAKSNLAAYSADEWKEKRLTNIYSVVLDKLYGISMAQKEIVHESIDEKTGLTTYYRFNFDTRFVTIKSDIELPRITVELLQEQLTMQVSPVQVLEAILPLRHFTFEGFTVVTLTDVTTEHTLGRLKDLSVPKEVCSDPTFGEQIQRALRTIVGNNEVHFGLLPFLRINNKVVFNHDISFKSLLIDMGRKYKAEEALFLHFAENYIEQPRLFFFRSIPNLTASNNLLIELLTKEGIGSYVVIPLHTKGQLVGVLEIYSNKPGAIDEKMLSKLSVAETMLAQLMQYTVESVKEEIGHVINDKFTPLQPAVAWKFNEAAWQYIRSMDDNGNNMTLPPVVFEKVYPLYGAVDVRNSTIERNNALKADLSVHFAILRETLAGIKHYGDRRLFKELKEKCDEWTNIVDTKISPYQTFKVEDYLYREVVPFLQDVRAWHSDTTEVIETYLRAIDEKTGAAWQNRRNFESSLKTINDCVGENLDRFNKHLQKTFPSYFEKFRTDGVEYDVYAGSSITPGKTLTRDILKDIRKKQLAVMAHIARQTKELLPRMSAPLQTTQLIFVHSTPIDIAFRTDERRFDVEGSYNIRYQVVKKRIDKVFIKNTSQRLTQPDTIAIVYFEQTEIADYLEGIMGLQNAQVLSNETEWLELEDLQGVNGLKAIRLYVKE
jgi:hypothetical protein